MSESRHPDPRLPVTVLSSFPGAGKTTLYGNLPGVPRARWPTHAEAQERGLVAQHGLSPRLWPNMADPLPVWGGAGV